MKKKIFFPFAFGLILPVIFAMTNFVLGAEEYPIKAITILSGMTAGGGSDTIARLLGEAAGKILGQPMVVENKAGAEGIVALMALKQSKPDGYKIMLVSDRLYYITPLERKVQYKLDDFSLIATIYTNQICFLSTPDKPWKNFKELVEYSKTHPGVIFAYQTSLDKILGEYIAMKEGIQWSFLPTKGGAEIVTLMLGGHADFGYVTGHHVPYVKAGKLRILAQAGAERQSLIPDIPTLTEQLGYEVSAELDFLMCAPAGVPDAIVKKLSDVFKEAQKDERFINYRKERVPNVFWGPEKTRENILKKAEYWRKMYEMVKK